MFEKLRLSASADQPRYRAFSRDKALERPCLSQNFIRAVLTEGILCRFVVGK